MIESGSLVPGIDPATFQLPAGTALRYEQPDPMLLPFFGSYAVLDSDISVFTGPNSWLLPGWAQIWIVLAQAPITVKVRNRQYPQLGAAVLYGPTSRAMPVESQGGVSIVIDISPLGWARWFDIAAEDYRDRITPLEDVWRASGANELIERLHASDRGPGVKAILDDFFLSHLPATKPSEPAVAHATSLLADPAITEIRDVAAAVGISAQALLRLCRRKFGYGPKFLMRRTRFLRALTEMMLADEPPDFARAPIGYHDVPHFLRDGSDFLGMTPRRFLAMPMPYLRSAMLARNLIIGAPWPVLDPLGAAGQG